MGRPLKITKQTASASPSGYVDLGYPNDGETDNEFTTNNIGVVGGISPIAVYPYVAVENIEQGVITASTADTTVSGLNTQFGGGTFTTGSLVYANGIDTALGTVASIHAAPSDTVTAVTASNERLTITASSGFVVGGAVVLASNISNLVGGTIYYVYDKPTSTTIRLSATPDLAAVFNISADASGSVAITGEETLTLTANATASVTQSAWSTSTVDRGFILRQKGKRKFLVARDNNINDEFFANGQTYYITDLQNTNWQALGAGPDAGVGKIFTCTGANPALTTNGVAWQVGVCTLVDKDSGDLLRNEMQLRLNKASGTDPKAQTISDHFALDFTDNGTDENAGTKYLVSFDAQTDTPDPATGLITVDIDYAC